MKISLLADHPLEAKVIAQWYYDEWLSNIPNITIERIVKKISKSTNRDKIPLMILAHKDDELAGVIELKIQENKNYLEYEHWLGGLFVKPKFRSQGLSHKLIMAAKEQANDFEVEHLYLQCESFNLKLYKKHGFSVLHTTTHAQTSVVIMKYSKNI